MKSVLSASAAILLTATAAYAQWGSDLRLTNNPARSFTSFNNACIQSNGSVVHVIWQDNRDGNVEVYYKRSPDGGQSWGPDRRLTSNSGDSQYPCVSIFGNTLHVAWCDDRDGNREIYYKRSPDDGLTWEPDQRLTSNPGVSNFPFISASGSAVHVAWFDDRDGNREIYCKRSLDGGFNWEADTRLTTDSSSSIFPALTAYGPNLHLVWEEYRDGNGEIYHKRSTDAGATWSADTRLTSNPANSFSPVVSVAESVVHVSWFDNRDGHGTEEEIYYKRSTDGGISWAPDRRMTHDASSAYFSFIRASGPDVHLVWDGFGSGNPEIDYMHSPDGGVNWEPLTRLTFNSANSYYPSLAVSGPMLHLVWFDERDGNMELYHKRNSTGNPTGGCPHPGCDTGLDADTMAIAMWT